LRQREEAVADGRARGEGGGGERRCNAPRACVQQDGKQQQAGKQGKASCLSGDGLGLGIGDCCV
jgi:hypothetical protein